MSQLISCIMPTADRPKFVPHAVAQFLAQHYIYKELIVLDSGDQSCERLIRDVPNVRYVRTSRKELGGLRNEAIRHARGEIISHWDDDDLHSPDQLGYMLNCLKYNWAPVVGIDKPLFLDVRTGLGYCHEKDEYGWVHGSAMMYRREVTHRVKFSGMVASDRWFVRDCVKAYIIPKPVMRNDVHVGLIHDGNVSPKDTKKPGWYCADLPKWIERAEYHEVLNNDKAKIQRRAVSRNGE